MEKQEMKEIDLSLMFHNKQALMVIRSLLDAFESQNHVHVNLNVLNWETGYAELCAVGEYASIYRTKNRNG